MKEDSDINGIDDHTAQDYENVKDESSNDYNFIREIIRRKPLNKSEIIKGIAALICAAVVFGAVAAFVFAKLFSVISGTTGARSQVMIPSDQKPEEASSENGEKLSSKEAFIGPMPHSDVSASLESTPKGESSGKSEDIKAAPGGAASGSGDVMPSDGAKNDNSSSSDGASSDDGDAALPENASDPKVDDNGDDSEQDGAANSVVEPEVSDSRSADNDSNADANTDGSDLASIGFNLGVEDYKKLCKERSDIASKFKDHIVTVSGITNGVDWFNNAFEKEKQASGLIFADNGKQLLVLTDYKVVTDVERILLNFCNGDIVDARYQAHDEDTRLAVLKVEKSDLAEELLNRVKPSGDILGNSYTLSSGEPIMALGSPNGISGSMLFGCLSSVGHAVYCRDAKYDLLVTDVSAPSCDISGVIVNYNSQVVGVITKAFNDDKNENVINALSISYLKPLLNKLSNAEPIPYIGITGRDITASMSENTGAPIGVYIESVAEDSPAMASGISAGGVVVKVGDDKVSTVAQYHDKLSQKEIGSVVKLTIASNGQHSYEENVVEVTVGTH